MQREKFVTISSCFSYTRALQLSLDESKITLPVDFGVIISKMRRNLDERFTNILNLSRVNFDPTFLVACALDPRTSPCLRDDDLEKAAEWIRQLLPLDQCQEIADEAPMNDKGYSDMLDIFIARLNTEARGNRRRIEGRTSQTKAWIMNILRVVQGAGGTGGSSIDPIKYWCRYLSSDWHSFAVLALEILSLSTTSAPIERIFSQAGLATKGIRNRTDFNLLNAQLVVYCNDSVC